MIFGARMTYDSPDFLIWSACIYLLILIEKRKDPRLWLLFGLLIGLGLLNKLTILLFFYLALSSFFIPFMMPVLKTEKLMEYVKLLGVDAGVKYEYTELSALPHENHKLLYYCSQPKVDLQSYRKTIREPVEEFERLLREEDLAAAADYFNSNIQNDPARLLITEDQINALGYEYLGENDVDKAMALFRFNMELYPGSFNVYDSYAESLMAAGINVQGSGTVRFLPISSSPSLPLSRPLSELRCFAWAMMRRTPSHRTGKQERR
jgi:tetratricopeptide (TPR) repeat protein